ncbi:MAG: hypothetical protein AAGF12_42755 [Myxococcota bacterium]
MGALSTRGADPEHRTWGRTECRAVELVGGRFRLQSARQEQIEFRIRNDHGDYQLHGLRYRYRSGPRSPGRRFEFVGTCQSNLGAAFRQPDGPLSTNAGPIFVSRESCQAGPSHFEERCIAGHCHIDVSLAQPFRVTGCEGEISRLRQHRMRLGNAHHDEVLRSMSRFIRLTREGGNVYERMPNGTCLQIQIEKREGSRIRLVIREPAQNGAEVSFSEYVVWPAFGRVSRERAWGFGPDSAWGTGGLPHTGSLYFGDGEVAFDGRAFFFRPRNCRAR